MISTVRLVHVNTNVTDIERSLAFYRDGIGLTPGTHTAPSDTQDGALFGLDRARWDGWLLGGANAERHQGLDLLQWLDPPTPADSAPAEVTDVGFHRIAVSSPDVHAAVQRCVALGGKIVADAHPVDLGNGSTLDMAMVTDPDGVQVELIAGRDVRFSHVIMHVSSRDRSVAYYRDVVGMEVLRESDVITQPGQLYGWDHDVSLKATLMRDRGSKALLDVVEWVDPAPTPARPQRANQLGLYRMAWATTDLDGARGELEAAGAEVRYADRLSVGAGLPLLRVLCWDGPDGECLELIEMTERIAEA